MNANKRMSTFPYVKVPVPIQDMYNVREIAALLGMSEDNVRRLRDRPEDPLPLTRLRGKARGYFIFREDFLEWCRRNIDRQAPPR